MISIYPDQTTFPVYCNNCYRGSDWNPLSYGMMYMPDQSFFAQFFKLQQQVPRLYFSSMNNENCDYSNHVAHCRNCYLLIGSMESEDCHYGYRVFHSRDCLDCLFINHCELCYECINCEDCYDVRYAFNCHQVRNSAHVEHCYGSTNLLYCAGVHQGHNQLLNQRYSQQDFSHLKEAIESSVELQEEYGQKFESLKQSLTLPTILEDRCEDCTGNFMVESKHCRNVYDVSKLQDVYHAHDCSNVTDSMDLYSVYGPGSLNYEVYSASVAVHNNICIRDCWPAEHLLYCDHCFGSKHCFGCIGLQNHTFCILNTQYTQEEYEQMVSIIIERMRLDLEWGEFFPMEISPFPLAETPASNRLIDPRKSFKVIAQERAFYEKMRLPIPTLHPDERHRLRLLKKQKYLSR